MPSLALKCDRDFKQVFCGNNSHCGGETQPMPCIRIIDVTNRDGVQTSRICLSKLQKTMLNLYLKRDGDFSE